MKNYPLNSNFPPKKWLTQDWLYLGTLALTGTLMLFTGLSIKSLWGSEGRWAEISREMLLTGNYFLPTINGMVYFDKPLLSYWAIIPFAYDGVVTEAAARMPGAIAGFFAVIATFSIGRRMFDGKMGFISSLFLLSSVMFVFWSRTASAETLNLLAIWMSFWIFISGANLGFLMHILLLYSICSVSAFCKGPLSPAVVFVSIIFYCAFETILEARKNRFSPNALKDAFFSKFIWIFSWQGLAGVFAGTLIFAVLLVIPVVFTGSWSSVELMWRENVQRFFRPFDHIEPFYIYFKHIPVFFAPWSVLAVASLWGIRRWKMGSSERFVILITIAIFLFFTFSGSRRSYYILPILPGLALITGKGIKDWLSDCKKSDNLTARFAAILTSSIITIAGLSLIYIYFDKRLPTHFSQIPLGILTASAGAMSLGFFIKNIPRRGIAALVIIVFTLEIWGFNVGMSVAEKNRTLKPFAVNVSNYLKNVDDNKISLYRTYDSALVFYLKRGPLKGLNTVEEVKSFQNNHKDGFLVANLPSILKLQQDGVLDGFSAIIVEKDLIEKHRDNLALFSFRD